MARNRIIPVEDVKRNMQLGWPYGQSEVHRYIPMLLARIEELEIALLPFADTARKVLPFTKPEEMQTKEFKHFIQALAMLDKDNSLVPIKEDFGIPAEG